MRLTQAMPKVAEKLKPLYFQQGEKIGGSALLPKDLRYKLLKRIRDLAEANGYEVWGLPRRFSPTKHGNLRWLMAYAKNKRRLKNAEPSGHAGRL